MDKKMFKSPGRLGHAGQILTNQKTIIDYIRDKGLLVWEVIVNLHILTRAVFVVGLDKRFQ